MYNATEVYTDGNYPPDAQIEHIAVKHLFRNTEHLEHSGHSSRINDTFKPTKFKRGQLRQNA